MNTTMDKVVRMVSLVRCDETVLRAALAIYKAARAKKSQKASFGVTMDKVAEILGRHEDSWDYANWAQQLVEVQGV